MTADDGVSGLARFREGAFDLVMTDLAMPDLSGFEVASQVKRRSPQTPVILVTGWNVSMGMDDLRRAGIDRVVMKPFQQDRIAGVLGEVFTSTPGGRSH